MRFQTCWTSRMYVTDVRALGAYLLFSMYLVLAQSKTIRSDVDLIKFMDGQLANTTLSLTLTLTGRSLTADFAGDEESHQIEELYVVFANSSGYLAEIQLNKRGSSRLSTFSSPYVAIDRDVGAGSLKFSSVDTWTGSAKITLPIAGQLKYAAGAKLEGGDPDSCSSYLCTYSLTNARISLPDLYVADLFNNFESRS